MYMSTIQIESRGISNVYTQSTFAKDIILESWKVPFCNIYTFCSLEDSVLTTHHSNGTIEILHAGQNVKQRIGNFVVSDACTLYSNGTVQITSMKDFMEMLYYNDNNIL